MELESDPTRILATFIDENNVALGTPFDLPTNVTAEQLEQICNKLLQNDDPTPYTFFVEEKEITDSLENVINKAEIETEKAVQIIYQPQAVFRVHKVNRCTSSMPGHAEAVISVSFSPDGRYLASGSGDTTVRFWDVNTETPHYTCEGHKHWVLAIAWSPNGEKLASGCKNGEVRLWNPKNGKMLGKLLKGHKQWINCLVWEPLHRDTECRRLASSSKDGTIRIWDTILCKTLFSLSSHLQSVTCIRWGGEGLIYSASQDRTIKVWRDEDGVLCRTLQGHGHWVNTMALNTSYAIRTGAYDPANKGKYSGESRDQQKDALARYNSIKGEKPEFLVSGSDDFTLFLWNPSESKKHIARMTGHQALINDVKFSPNGRLIASASFDKSIKLWDGKNGKFISAFRGHVSSVYQISWSADSRLLCSGSSDSTLKVWSLKTKKILCDLPGHADEELSFFNRYPTKMGVVCHAYLYITDYEFLLAELHKVFAVDWSPDGERVASGGKDRVLKIYANIEIEEYNRRLSGTVEKFKHFLN